MLKTQSTPSLEGTILNDEMTRALTIERLQSHLALEIEGYKASSELIHEIAIHAAVTGRLIEASCQELEVDIGANRVREHLNACLAPERLTELEAKANAALQEGLPRKVRRAAGELAIDLHDQPYYGKDDELTCRGEAKAGTTRCYRVATAYLLHEGVRFTLALLFVRPEYSMAEILEKLLARLESASLTVKRLWLDKGFASIPVYRLLEKRELKAVIACPIRGKPTGQGTRALCKGKAGYPTHHTFRSSKYGSYQVPLTIVRTWSMTRQGKRRWTYLAFVQLGTSLAPSRVRASYRLRFGVESSYRCMRSVKAKTSTRNPAVRLFFMALAFILVNLWILLRFRFCQIPQRGRSGRPLDEARFRLGRFASFLQQAIERYLGIVTAISATAPPIGV
jgi:putative transposase